MVVEYLRATQHPVPVEQHQNWGVLGYLYHLFNQLAVQNRWLLHHVGNCKFFTNVGIQKIKGRYRKQDGHSNSIQACYKNTGQDLRVLEVNYVISSVVEVEILGHRRLSSNI